MVPIHHSFITECVARSQNTQLNWTQFSKSSDFFEILLCEDKCCVIVCVKNVFNFHRNISSLIVVQSSYSSTYLERSFRHWNEGYFKGYRNQLKTNTEKSQCATKTDVQKRKQGNKNKSKENKIKDRIHNTKYKIKIRVSSEHH